MLITLDYGTNTNTRNTNMYPPLIASTKIHSLTYPPLIRWVNGIWVIPPLLTHTPTPSLTHTLPPPPPTHIPSSDQVGKWHLGYSTTAHKPLSRGFDEYYGFLMGKVIIWLGHNNVWLALTIILLTNTMASSRARELFDWAIIMFDSRLY